MSGHTCHVTHEDCSETQTVQRHETDGWMPQGVFPSSHVSVVVCVCVCSGECSLFSCCLVFSVVVCVCVCVCSLFSCCLVFSVVVCVCVCVCSLFSCCLVFSVVVCVLVLL